MTSTLTIRSGWLSSGLGIAGVCATLIGCSSPSGDAPPAGSTAQSAATANAPVVVYSSRQEHLIQPLFEAYTKQTGIKVEYLIDKEGPLMLKLAAEGSNTPADVFMTVDAGNLWHAANEGLLQSLDSPVLDAKVPEYLRDPQGRWYGISVRARTIAYNTDKVPVAQLSTYEALADSAWAGRVCLRTSKKVYNQSLVAMMMAEHGEPAAEKIVAGWVANLAAPVFSSDTRVLEAIAAGQCDVGIVNSYYFGRLMKEKPALPLALFWPNQLTNGVHVNVAGAGVVSQSDNPAGAQQLLEWLASDQAQAMFAAVNLEYPANEAVAVDPAVQAWGTFKRNLINVASAGEMQSKAVMLMDRVGYD